MNCPKCGNELSSEMIEGKICWECGYELTQEFFNEEEEKQKKLDKERAEREKEQYQFKDSKEYKEHMLTTGYNFEGYKITAYHGVISGQVVLGTGVLTDWDTGISDFFGEEAEGLGDKLEEAKERAIKRLIKKSIVLHGNAVIGVDFDYITFNNNDCVGISANGTSVTIEKIVETEE